MVPHPHQGVHRIDALHVPKKLNIKKVGTGQHSRRADRSRRTFQEDARILHSPRQHVAIDKKVVVRICKGPGSKALIGTNQKQLLGFEVEAQVQFRVIQAVRANVQNSFHTLPAELVSTQNEK